MGIRDLTVVIMTYNRPRYIRRAVAFHERRNQHALIIDGSDNAALSIQEQSELRAVRYIHAREPYNKRLAMAGSLVQTQFVVLHGDDEFVLTDGLESCCQVLRSRSEISSVCGIPLFQRRLESGKWHVYPWTSGIPPLNWANASVIDSRPIVRLQRHFDPFCPTSMYGVMRNSAFAPITQSISLLSIPNIYREEYFFESVLAVVGSIYVLPVVAWIRSNENISITERELDVGFFEFLACSTSDGALEDFVELVFTTAQAIEPTISLNRGELVDTFKALIQSRGQDVQTSPDSALWKARARQWIAGIPFVRTPGRVCRDVLQGTFSRNPWVRSGKRMIRNGIRSDLAELREVSDAVLQFHR